MVTATASVNKKLTAFDDYLKYGTDEERPKGESTRDAYCWTVDLLQRYLDGRRPTPELAKEFIKSLEEKGNVASSINRHIWALKSYFRFLKASVDPETADFKIRGLAVEEYYPRYLKDKEWERLVETATAPIYDPQLPDLARRRAKLELALLYAYCGGGLRCSEAIGLKENDLFDEGYIRVMGKGRREGIVPIEPEVLRMIKDWIAIKGKNGPYIFPGKDPDTHMAPTTAQGIIKRLCVRAGLNDVHIHSLRHTAGYQLRNAGASERDIQDVLRHKNIATTRIYTHLRDEDLKRRLPKRFGKPKQGRMELV